MRPSHGVHDLGRLVDEVAGADETWPTSMSSRTDGTGSGR
jgi:hypothetical protein